ncbi:hypothetical protein I4F81_009477 [Pyropia yezoensis]|uniref:Uncharacterized protein n=1 Tax=Pyropia yezoensis TaxID=2788 RepID=A0ACC3CA22_PYRYE|nr:hypothetical protein I4F81_009477 [Neopyropia yezoensis]
MTKQERENSQAEWRLAVAQHVAGVSPPTAADRALGELQTALNAFGSAPARFSLDTLYRAVTSSRILDVRCLRCAHQLLVHASSAGLFPPADSSERQQDFYDRFYAPVLRQLEEGAGPVVAAVVDDAVRLGLVSSTHRSIMQSALHLRVCFARQLNQVNRRLNRLELAVDNTGQLLFNTIQELRRLQHHLQAKEAHERKVALAKSLAKLGVSLVPIVGGAINTGIDAVVEIVDVSSGTSAVFRSLAVPSDITAARQVLRCIADAKDLSHEELERVQEFVDRLQPYESLEQVDRDLGCAVEVLELNAEAAPVPGMDAMVAQVSGAEVGLPDIGGADAEHDAGDDKWTKPTDVLVDASIDHGGDVVSERLRKQPAQRPGVRPIKADVGWSSAGRCGAAVAAGLSSDGSTVVPADEPVHSAVRPTAPTHHIPPGRLVTASQALSVTTSPRYGREFFAGILDWDCDALKDKLLDKEGMRESVRSFIKDAQQFSS